MYKSSAILYTFSYMAIGCFTPYIGLYLKGLSFCGTQIGIITAIGTTAAIFAVAVWGRIYSASDHKAVIIELLCLGSICVAAVLSGMSAFFFVMLCYGVLYFFQSPIMSLIDSYTALGEGSGDFGSKRAWGAVGFAAGVFVSGKMIDMTTDKIIFILYGASFAIAAIAMASIRKAASGSKFSNGGAGERSNERSSNVKSKGYIYLLSDSRVVKLLICMFFFGGTNVANNTYFGFLFIEGGGTAAGIGTAMLLMVGSEVPFMFLSEKLARRFTIEKTILAAMIISVIRFLLYGVGLPWYVLIALFFTQGAVNGIILVEFVRYIAKIAPHDCRSLAISAYYVFGSNISTIICQFVGGIVLDVYGASGVYMFFGLFNLTGVILYMLFGLQKQQQKTESTVSGD